ncbi:MAG: sensor histidine kinase N-terminal domain-containing protein [Rhodoplanes sp.]|uniref:sensor histidine kinase n=1 Tax=Rhodoplanes sp. TaxID=1968906 RepID=UPI00184F0E29|nr:ATP-binding protein [Rhodoplanes sp.]NVO15043.1 sensor histidine kinase N-terminal domain-containing protein [Rhodoplanes sp.]
MLRARSIVSRILWMHVMAVGTIAVLVPLSLYFLLVAETTSLHRESMREQADRLAARLSLVDGRWRLTLPQELQDVYSEAYGRYAYAIVDADGAVLFSSHNAEQRIFPDAPRSSEPEFLQVQRAYSSLSGVVIPKADGDRTVYIEVAENLSHRDVLIDDIVSNFIPRVAWITLPILLLLLGVETHVVRRVFRPVWAASQRAREISPRRTDIRLSLQDIPNEIAPLVVAVNEALDRLEQGFRVQREFTADAAHELRTPITILRTRIDTLGDDRVAEPLRRDLETMTRVVTQLLEMAEVENMAPGDGERADLRAVAADVIGFLVPLAITQERSIALSGVEEPVWVAGHGEVIARAIRNLIENAIRHTPAGTVVEVSVEGDGSVQVCDEGAGIDEAERELLFRRFWRRDRKRSGGAGLGLSIVKRIMDLCGGSVAVANRPEGGACFMLRFRLAVGSGEARAPARPEPQHAGDAATHDA